jgi:hypothetical protein
MSSEVEQGTVAFWVTVPAKNSIDIKEWFVHRGTSGVEKVTEEARAPGLITVPAWEKS